MSQIDYSIIIPAYNEEESLKPLWQQLKPTLDGLPGISEVLLINDGSTDGSDAIMRELAKSDERIRIIRFPRNRGKAAVLQAGFQGSRGQFVITMDADLQDDPSEISKLLAILEQGYDLVSGWKKNRHDPFHKTVPSYFFNGLIRLLSGVKLHDVNCGLKAYRQPVVKNLSVYGELYRFIPILAASEGFKITEVVVNHRPRKFGKSKYGVTRFIRGFLDLLTVTFLTKFLKRPLHLFGSIGLILFNAGLLISIYLSYLRLIEHQSIGDRPLLLFGILLILAGLQLLFTGLLAELITYYAHKSPDYFAFDASWEISHDQADHNARQPKQAVR